MTKYIDCDLKDLVVVDPIAGGYILRYILSFLYDYFILFFTNFQF